MGFRLKPMNCLGLSIKKDVKTKKLKSVKINDFLYFFKENLIKLKQQTKINWLFVFRTQFIDILCRFDQQKNESKHRISLFECKSVIIVMANEIIFNAVFS